MRELIVSPVIAPQATTGRPRTVVVTLTCAWCAREVYDVPGEIDAAGGQLRIGPNPRFHLARGRALCTECGGSLLMSDWKAAVEQPRARPAAQAA
jgi:hypothetical protein